MNTGGTICRTGLALLLFILTAMTVCGQSSQIERKMIDISTDESYIFGQATRDTEQAARDDARAELVMAIKTSLTADYHDVEKIEDDVYSAEQRRELRASSAVTIENCRTLIYQDKKGLWHCMQYITVEERDAAEKERKSHIQDLVNLGMQQEGNLNIAGALKYYVWALNMLRCYGDRVEVNVEGSTKNARPWLQQHIPDVISNVKVTLNDSRIEYDDTDYDHYTVNLSIDYVGEPVSAVDLSYFNGEREIKPLHAKNGEASLKFHSLEGVSQIDLKVIYDYPDEAKNYDPELAVVYTQPQRMRFDSYALRDLPVKIKKDKITGAKKGKEQPQSPVTNAIVKTPRPTIERPVESDSTDYIAKMEAVEKALRTGKKETVQPLFTDEGWALFNLMLKSGKVKVSRKPKSYSVESSPLFTIGKGIPISIKVGGHVSNETLVFRFDKETGLIKSIAYALTKRAENDIFRDAQWSLDSRYSLLTFMEDYQTAFALKRLDYINSIFSNDAVIIVGKVGDSPSQPSCLLEMKELQVKGQDVTYNTYTKDQYIENLRNDFNNPGKPYIQLTFEDAVISRAPTDGFVNHEVMWIEIKQQYDSPAYSDKGFLTLQINLSPTNSQINVRTWTPQFIPLDVLKNKYKVGFQ